MLNPVSNQQGALPNWLRLSWLFISPLGIAFAGRIAWEKTVWTIKRGPQTVGFSLIHIHPTFFIFGVLSASLLMVWIIPAAIYLVLGRNRISKTDVLMLICAGLVATAMIIPDHFFAAAK